VPRPSILSHTFTQTRGSCLVLWLAVLDDSANALFMTEIVRGMAYTIKAFFEPKVTVSSEETAAVLLSEHGHSLLMDHTSALPSVLHLSPSWQMKLLL